MKIKTKIKKCNQCEETKNIYAKGLCKYCYNKRDQEKRRTKARATREVKGYSSKGNGLGYLNNFTKPKKPIPKRSKNGQKVASEDSMFFRKIWKERIHYSQISGTYLGDEYNPVFFSHILTKGAYPKSRHWKDNIVLMTFEEHQEYEFGDRSKPEFKAKYRDVLKRYGELIIRYYQE